MAEEKPKLRMRLGPLWFPVPARFLCWRLQKRLENTWPETQKEIAAAWDSRVPVRLKRKAPIRPRYRATYKSDPLPNILAIADEYEREHDLAQGSESDADSG